MFRSKVLPKVLPGTNDIFNPEYEYRNSIVKIITILFKGDNSENSNVFFKEQKEIKLKNQYDITVETLTGSLAFIYNYFCLYLNSTETELESQRKLFKEYINKFCKNIDNTEEIIKTIDELATNIQSSTFFAKTRIQFINGIFSGPVQKEIREKLIREEKLKQEKTLQLIQEETEKTLEEKTYSQDKDTPTTPKEILADKKETQTLLTKNTKREEFLSILSENPKQFYYTFIANVRPLSIGLTENERKFIDTYEKVAQNQSLGDFDIWSFINKNKNKELEENQENFLQEFNKLSDKDRYNLVIEAININIEKGRNKGFFSKHKKEIVFWVILLTGITLGFLFGLGVGGLGAGATITWMASLFGIESTVGAISIGVSIVAGMSFVIGSIITWVRERRLLNKKSNDTHAMVSESSSVPLPVSGSQTKIDSGLRKNQKQEVLPANLSFSSDSSPFPEIPQSASFLPPPSTGSSSTNSLSNASTTTIKKQQR